MLISCVSEGSHKNYKLYLLFNKVSANTIFTSIKQESITIKARLPQLLILAYPFLLLLILHYFSYFIVLTFNSLKSLELFLQAFILAAILHLLMQVFGLNLLAHVFMSTSAKRWTCYLHIFKWCCLIQLLTWI